MKPEQIERLKARRDRLAGQRDVLASSDEPDGAAARSQMVADLDALLLKIDGTLTGASPKRRKARVLRPTVDHQQVVDLTRIRKTDRAEVRVVVKEWKGRRTVDVRLWYLPDGETEMAPSRKGVSIDAAKLGALITALRLAEQHLGGGS